MSRMIEFRTDSELPVYDEAEALIGLVICYVMKAQEGAVALKIVEAKKVRTLGGRHAAELVVNARWSLSRWIHRKTLRLALEEAVNGFELFYENGEVAVVLNLVFTASRKGANRKKAERLADEARAKIGIGPVPV